ncbi:MAG: beta-lactamase family protein [Spirochaetaceae bacterium]
MNKKKCVILQSIFIASLIIILTGCDSKTIEKEVDSYIETFSEYKAFHGSILIASGDNILVRKGYGMANVEHEVKNNSNTKFRIGSMTKQFTAMAILILQEKGLLNISDNIDQYIPNCPESWKEITIHQLLTHTSGIPNFTSFPEYMDVMKKEHSVLQIMSLFMDKSLKYTPGKFFSYSNSGYIVLGYIIEKVSNKKYEDYLNEHIFKKIGMKNTGYDHNKEIIKNRATGYYFNGTQNADYIHMSVPHAAGALYSTVEDLYLWDRALYTDKIVNKKSLDSMFTNYIGSYGYGWKINETQSNSKLIEHDGMINGFSSYIGRYIDDDLVLIILSNDGTQGRLILPSITKIVTNYLP